MTTPSSAENYDDAKAGSQGWLLISYNTFSITFRELINEANKVSHW